MSISPNLWSNSSHEFKLAMGERKPPFHFGQNVCDYKVSLLDNKGESIEQWIEVAGRGGG